MFWTQRLGDFFDVRRHVMSVARLLPLLEEQQLLAREYAVYWRIRLPDVCVSMTFN